jgi:hypothetical protein
MIKNKTQWLVASERRWRSSPELWHAVKKVLHLVTAFTVGHSITLAASTLGLVSLPSRPIEILIAVSVAVAAVHALRPIATRGEVPIAAGFGLVHGLAFAEILNNLGLSGTTTIPTRLGFNLGSEAAQLVTVGLAFLSLWLLSRTPVYPTVRVTGAGVVLVAATAWISERLGLWSDPFAGVESWAIDHLVLIAGLLAAFALMIWISARPRRGAGERGPQNIFEISRPSQLSETAPKVRLGGVGLVPPRAHIGVRIASLASVSASLDRS